MEPAQIYTTKKCTGQTQCVFIPMIYRFRRKRVFERTLIICTANSVYYVRAHCQIDRETLDLRKSKRVNARARMEIFYASVLSGNLLCGYCIILGFVTIYMLLLNFYFNPGTLS